jgi:single-stranded-DNA-specific exonuclease
VLSRIYCARQVESPADLEYELGSLIPPSHLGGLTEAAGLLRECAEQGRRILVVGDFDADGATSTALALRALRAMGLDDVHYLVPNRFEYGYGLTPEIVAVGRELEPDLIITVDNGISSVDGVAAACEAGIRVLVTDHHLPGPELPRADAIVNPNLEDDAFPSKALAGVGVIFYVMLALRAELRSSGWFETRHLAEPNMAQFLDLVALGTVADVVPLDRNNRVLVDQGLRRIRSGRAAAGIEALLRIGGRDPARVSASDLGYAVGPRLNAAGRLEDMSVGIECLLTDDASRAQELAAGLDALNRERREIEAQMRDEALRELDHLREPLNGDQMPFGIVLHDPGWHQGVIGIVAARIKERFHRPVVALAPAGAGVLKGSARSIPGLHIRDALDSLAATRPGLLTKFGGHAMAAGLSLPERALGDFRSAFDQVVRERIGPDDLRQVIHSDGELDAEDLDLAMAERLRAAGPWGQAFPEPVFDGCFDVASRRVVGRNHLKMVLEPSGGGRQIEAIQFNVEPDQIPDEGEAVRVAYRLDVNEFRGLRSVQLTVEYLERHVSGE